MKPAIFLDRDGTVIRHVHHLVDVEEVELLPGAAEGIRRLRNAGFVIVLVTNQSVVGRAMIDQAGLERIHRRMGDLLAEHDAYLDAIYWCGHVPERDDEIVPTHPDRKPAPGMLLRAAADLDLDVSRSWMVGDTARDMRAGSAAGCLGNVLLLSGASLKKPSDEVTADVTAADLAEASIVIGKYAETGAPTSVPHRRPS